MNCISWNWLGLPAMVLVTSSLLFFSNKWEPQFWRRMKNVKQHKNLISVLNLLKAVLRRCWGGSGYCSLSNCAPNPSVRDFSFFVALLHLRNLFIKGLAHGSFINWEIQWTKLLGVLLLVSLRIGLILVNYCHCFEWPTNWFSASLSVLKYAL